MGNFPGNFLARYGIVAFLNLGDIIISGLYHFLHFIGKASGLSFHLYCLFFFLLLLVLKLPLRLLILLIGFMADNQTGLQPIHVSLLKPADFNQLLQIIADKLLIFPICSASSLTLQ